MQIVTVARSRQKEMGYKCRPGPESKSLVVSKAERVVPVEQQHWKAEDKPQVQL